MKKIMFVLSLVAFFSSVSHNAQCAATDNGHCAATDKYSGETLYKKHCSTCHPHAYKLKSVKDLVKSIRNPPPYMPIFDEYKISNDDAKKIADYVKQGLTDLW